MLSLKPTCFLQAAQGNLQPHPHHSSPYTPRKGQLGHRGIDREGGAQDPVSTAAWTMAAKLLPLCRRLVAPARP